MEYFKLNNGIKIPAIGYGTYMIAPSDTEKNVSKALKEGYRLIDTAQNYRNELGVGIAIRNSNIPRDEIFLTTKSETVGYEQTKKGIDDSLKTFGLDYLDLVLIHWPNSDNIGTYRAIEDLYLEGRIRSIGLSNFNHEQIESILINSRVKPVIDQIETHITWQQSKMHFFLKENDILHESWAPLGEGSGNVLENTLLKKIGLRYQKSPAQVMLRFYLQNHILAIPRTVNLFHMDQNINIFDFKLTKAELAAIRNEDQGKSLSKWPQTMRIEEG